MCLKNVSDLNLKWNEKENCFVGIGYKKLELDITDSLGRINHSRFKDTNIFQYSDKLENGWYEARGHQRSVRDGVDDSSLLAANNGHQYFPGYHIFLNLSDAEKYYNNYGTVVEVMFSDVTSFGKNEISHNEYGDCVVAKYIKIVGLAKPKK